MPTQKYQIHISKFCARVYRQHEDKCGPPPAASETMTNGGAGNFNDESAEAAWSKRWGTQTPISHVDSIPPDDDVYEGFDQKARPMDALPAYLAERSGISYQDAVEYIWRARFGCQWSGLNLLSGEVRRDVTAIAKTVSAYFSGAAMDELLGWFTDLYPQEASEMGLALPTSADASKAVPGGQPASKGMSWKKAQEAAERHVKRNKNVFPGVNALARIVGCVPSTALKAIRNSPYLAARKAEHEQAAKKPKEVALTVAILDTTPLQPEIEPREATLARLAQEQADEQVREDRQHAKRRHTRTTHD